MLVIKLETPTVAGVSSKQTYSRPILFQKDHLHRVDEVTSLDPVEIETTADSRSSDALAVPGNTIVPRLHHVINQRQWAVF